MSSPELEAARLLLARLGVTPEQLVTTPTTARTIPTFGEYIPRVCGASPPGTRRVYDSYWKRALQAWSQRRLDEPTALEIQQLAEQIRGNVVLRRNARGGRSAAEHMISALRCVYRHAVRDGLISEAHNPAVRVPKPRRLASTRRALSARSLAQINEVVATTGNDPALDTLLLRLHTETACRRGGALTLRREDLDLTQCLLRLREKGDTVRWQPISPTLTRHLNAHSDERNHAAAHQRLLTYRGGQPITARRYDYLWSRVGQHLPWAATQQISTHWLRHTTLTWVERHFGYAITRAYAGHSARNDAGATATYIRADIHEVAAALSALTGEQHPLSRPAPDAPPAHRPALSDPAV